MSTLLFLLALMVGGSSEGLPMATPGHMQTRQEWTLAGVRTRSLWCKTPTPSLKALQVQALLGFVFLSSANLWLMNTSEQTLLSLKSTGKFLCSTQEKEGLHADLQ